MRIPGITTAAATVAALAVLGHGLAVPEASISASTFADPQAAGLAFTEQPATSNSTITELVTRGELAALGPSRRRRKGARRRARKPKNNKISCSPHPCALDCNSIFTLVTLGVACGKLSPPDVFFLLFFFFFFMAFSSGYLMSCFRVLLTFHCLAKPFAISSQIARRFDGLLWSWLPSVEILTTVWFSILV